MTLRPKSGAHRRRRGRKGRTGPGLARVRAWRPRRGRRAENGGPDRRASGGRSPVTLARLSEAARGRTRSRGPKDRSVERRRARALVLGAMVFAAVVLLVALPWTTLLNQHTQLSSATAETDQLQVENKALAAQAKELSSAATQSALARQDYGLVRKGQTAYDILPPPGAAANEAIEAGHVPLDEPPVVPGSRRSQELLGAGVVNPTSAASSSPGSTAGATTGESTPAASRPAASRSSSSSPNASAAPARLPTGGFWSRVGATLEFWN